MPDQFTINIPIAQGRYTKLSLKAGDVLYLLGANGTGKSSLVSHLYADNQSHSKRISAHRQTWLDSNTLNLTPQSRQQVESNFRGMDAQIQARYMDWNPLQRLHVAIFDLIAAGTARARQITEFVETGNDEAARKMAKKPGPLQVINDLMRMANLPIEISVVEGEQIVARKNNGVPYSVAALSDGERNAFLIACEVLTAKPGSLIIIDEPERHLHRSIISSLLRLLFGQRKDCSFVVSTHEVMLPVDTPNATAFLIRGCQYVSEQAQSGISTCCRQVLRSMRKQRECCLALVEE